MLLPLRPRLLLVALAAFAPNVRGQGRACAIAEPRVTLPLEVSQGGAGSAASAPRPAQTLYAAAVRIAPTLGIGCGRRVTIAAVGAEHVIGRTARPMGGGSVALRLFAPTALGGLVSAPLFLSGEGLWGRERTLVSGALTLDLLRVLRVTARAGRDVDQRRNFGEIGVGTDLRRWFGNSSPPPPVVRPSDVADLDSFPRFLAVRMRSRASWLLDPDAVPQLDSARAIVDEASRAPTVAALRTLVAARGPKRLSETIARVLSDALLGHTGRAAVLDADDPAFQRTLVDALVRGWRAAMTP
jgi:hypothetical protein